MNLEMFSLLSDKKLNSSPVALLDIVNQCTKRISKCRLSSSQVWHLSSKPMQACIITDGSLHNIGTELE